MKPTYGRVSRYGLAAFASSLDQIGPLARTVADAALLLRVLSGNDPRDGTSLANPVPDYSAALAAPRAPWKIGVPREFFGEGLAPGIRAEIEKTIAFYRAQGSTIVPVSLPLTRYAVSVYYILATAEASANLARYDGIRYGHRSPDATDAVDIFEKSRAEGFGPEVKRRVILGTYVLTSGYYDAYYLRAQKVRAFIRDDFMRVFGEVDFVLTPVTSAPPPKLGAAGSDPLAQYLADIYTIPVNLAGLPGISVPCGVADGLPVGLQLIGKPLDETTLLAAANAFELGTKN
jgi:aspartyl-tRNA(Asn)/glutamyl-tRNA(Gln) amidotransferase subunit A